MKIKLEYKNKYEIELEKVILPKQNKYLDEDYNFFPIYSFFWQIYEKYGFTKICKLIYLMFKKECNDKENKILSEIYDAEFMDIIMIRHKLKLNDYPKLLTRLNFGKQKEEIIQNFNNINESIKNILRDSLKINNNAVNYICFWIMNDYEFLLFYNNEFKNDPLLFFQKINNKIKESDFDKSRDFYVKKVHIDNILSIYNEVYGRLETITNFMNRPNKETKMIHCIKNLNINEEEKKKIINFWIIRGKYFAHKENFVEEFWLKDISELENIENVMKEYKIILIE